MKTSLRCLVAATTAAVTLAPLALSAELPSSTEASTRAWRAELGRPAPDFELTDLAGKAWKLSDFRGKTVVLEWFNPECPAVKGAHKSGGSLETLGNRMHAADDVVWLAINSGAPGNQGHSLEANQKGVEAMGIDYPVLRDESGWVGRMYGARTTPHLYVVDARGALAYAGGHDDRSGTSYIGDALGELRGGQKISKPETRNYGCSVKYARKPALGLAVPDFELQDTDGNAVRVSDFRGKPLVLEWFNPKCPYVVGAHGDDGTLKDAARRAAKEGVAWLAINSAPEGHATTGPENTRAASAWGMAHPILLDHDGKVGKMFGAKTTPQMFVLDARGVLVYAGAHDDKGGTSFVDQALREVLAGKSVSKPETKSYGCGVKYGS